ALEALWSRQRRMAEELTADIAGRSPDAPYRRVMLTIAERIAATRTRDADLAYGSPDELLADLRVVQDSLAASDPRRAYGDLQSLIWQLENYGLHLAALDVRQQSALHAKTSADTDAGRPPSDMSEEVLETFRAIAAVQRRHGVLAARRYIVSFTQDAQDIANVYRLAEIALGTPEDVPVIDAI